VSRPVRKDREQLAAAMYHDAGGDWAHADPYARWVWRRRAARRLREAEPRSAQLVASGTLLYWLTRGDREEW
jgi:acyl-CoA reductase-like NAD-dependent aldehyde dehydrogenase